MNKPYISVGQLICEAVAGFILVVSLLYGVILAITITEPVPIHYDYSGNVDGYGSAWTAIIMPVAMLGLNLLISAIAHFSKPASWNMPFKVNERNAIFVYHDVVWLYVIMEILFAIMALFYTVFLTINGSLIAVFSIIMSILLIPVIIITVRQSKKHNVQ